MGRGGRRGALWALVGVLTGCGASDALRPLEASAALEQVRLDFGDVPVGFRKELHARLRNTGYMPFRLLDVIPRDADPSFEIQFDVSEKVEPGETREVTLVFHPLREGALTDSISLNTDVPRATFSNVALEGHGTPTPIEFEPPLLDFETLEIESDRALSIAVKNPGDLPLTLTLQGPQASEFDAGSWTVGPLATVDIPARFFPHAVGERNARLEARSCEGCTPSAAGLKGQSVESALVFDPSPVPFEPVPVHQRSESLTRVRNITWRPLSLGRVDSSEPSFSALRELSGTVLDPARGVDLPIEFSARGPGPRLAELLVRYVSDQPRTGRVTLDATGGRPQLALAPVAIDFGELPVGGKRAQVVRLSNAGSAGHLHFRGLSASGATGQFSVGAPRRDQAQLAWNGGAWPELTSADLPIAPAPDFIDVPVYFEPVLAGEFEARIVFRTDDPFYPTRDVVVRGASHPGGPCQFGLEPWPSLDFGNVPPNSGAVLGFRFENTGTTECAVKDIQLTDSSGGAFFMPGGALVGGVLGPHDAFSAQIAFRSLTPGAFRGELGMTVNNPAEPEVRLPLTAVAADSCLVAAPPFLDFGAVRYDCPAPTRRTFISNACSEPITVTQVEIGRGTSTEFSLPTRPTLPQTLAPFEGFELSASFARTLLGQQFAPLWLSVAGENTPRLIPLLGETNHEGLQRDVFVQGTDRQIDLLFVVSNTSTMSDHQARLASALPGYFARATAAGVQLRVGVTSTGLVRRETCAGGAAGAESGRLVPVDSRRARWVDAASPGAAAIAGANVRLGDCHYLVQGLEAMRMALTPPLSDHEDDPRTAQPADGNLGFIRGAAQLSVVVLADEDDRSGFDPVGYAELIDSLKGPSATQRTRLDAWVPTDSSCPTAGPDAPRFAEVAHRTGGEVHSVCTADFGPLLDGLLAPARGLQRRFQLTAAPNVADGFRVSVAGSAVPEGSGFHYDAPSNSIVLEQPHVPRPGEQVVVTYRSRCGT